MAPEARDGLVTAQGHHYAPEIVPGPLGCLILETVIWGRAPSSQCQISRAHRAPETARGATLFPIFRAYVGFPCSCG